MAQYAPQAGVAGSTAIHSSSPQFKSWANNCHIYRGWIDIAQPSLGLVTSGDSSMAVGPANFSVVSLGDSGVAVLTFPKPIVNTTSTSVSVSTFPNPVSDVLTVAASQPVRLTLTDISGKLIWQHAAASNAAFSMQGYSSGLYFLTFKDNNGYQWVERIVKQ